MVSRQSRGDLAAQRRAACRLQRRIQGVLIQHVHEPVAERERAIRKLVLADGSHEHVHPIERLEPLLDLARIDAKGFADDCRIELVALYARGEGQLPIVVCQSANLARDHASHGFRQLTLDFVEGPGQDPSTAILSQHSAIFEVTQEISHEERAAFGFRMDELSELARESMLLELDREVTFDVVSIEELER